MTKIALIGFLPNQQRILASQLPGLDIQFISAEQRRFALRQVELVVLWAKFISHRVSERVQAQANCRVYIHRGGLKEMRAFLEEWKRGAK